METLTTQVRAGVPRWKCEEVYNQIKQLIRTKPDMTRNVKRSDLEFLMAMGLQVDDPSMRVKLLNECLVYVYIYGGPHTSRELEYKRESRQRRSER